MVAIPSPLSDRAPVPLVPRHGVPLPRRVRRDDQAGIRQPVARHRLAEGEAANPGEALEHLEPEADVLPTCPDRVLAATGRQAAPLAVGHVREEGRQVLLVARCAVDGGLSGEPVVDAFPRETAHLQNRAGKEWLLIEFYNGELEIWRRR